MSNTKKEREYYNKMRERVCERLGIDENVFNWFRRAGNKLHKIYENDCNGYYEGEDESEKLENPIYERVNKKAKSLELFVFYQTDPRGATIYLDKKPISDNNYTQSHCIY